MTSLFTLLMWVLILGFVAYAIHTWATFLPPLFRKIGVGLCLLVLAYLVLDAVGIIDSLKGVKVPRV